MLYLIYGEDSYRARKSVGAIIDNLTARDLQAAVHRIDAEKASEEKIKDLICGQNIFGHKSVVLFEGLLESDLADFFTGLVKSMADSENIYIILERKPDSKLIKKISKFAQKVLKLDKLSAEKTKKWLEAEAKTRGLVLSKAEADFLGSNFGSNLWAISQALELKSLGGGINVQKFIYNPFGLTDLFILKKRREAYQHFHRSLIGGVSAEEMFWKFWWQVKTLLIVSAGQDSRSDLHPFVVKKSLAALSRFKREELEKIWEDLFLLWRDSKSGKIELSLGLERLILSPS